MHSLLRCTIAAALALSCGAAPAQVTPPTPAPVRPFAPILGEHVAIEAWSGMCPAPYFDPGQAPEIRQLSHTPGAGGPQQDQYTHELVYRMKVSEICFSPPPPAMFGGLIDLGNELPQGHHDVLVKGVTEDDEVYVEYEVAFYVGPADGVRSDASGMWYAPEQNGRGVTVALRGDSGFVYWATHDGEGDPAWNLLATPLNMAEDRNVIEGTAITTRGTPLAPGAAELESEDWGEVRFEYKGCGVASMSWDAIDPAIEDGSLDLVQVLQPDGVYVCDVVNQPDRVEALWVEVPTP